MPSKKKLNLRELLSGIKIAPPIELDEICDDSRYLKKGDVFFACQGLNSHGLDFIESAVDSGAVAVIYELPYEIPKLEYEIPLIGIENLGEKLGEIANRWYGYPSHSLNVIGITGTNGKTTVSWLIQHCFSHLKQKCGYIGTLGYGVEKLFSNDLTTPSCINLHRILSEFQDLGVKYVALEVSSHAIAQNRISGISFDATIFTNLSRDHIDYHGDMASYGEVKAKLFTEIESKIKIINSNDKFGRKLINRLEGDIVITSNESSIPTDSYSYVSMLNKEAVEFGFRVEVESTWGKCKINLPLLGVFNIENALQVMALLLVYEFCPKDVFNAIENITPPKGRMELIKLSLTSGSPRVVVDFSHTPEALKVSLSALRLHFKKKIWCVFGCGGSRDIGKRKVMGQIAEANADYMVVTSDNPRNEDADKIIADILEGVNGKVSVISDRFAAIDFAINSANKEDVILIAGKGHEDYQIINGNKTEFSDQNISKELIKVRLTRKSND